ncbi:AIM24 family protein [Nocardioides luteus]|uniref:Tellurium resistance protein n=1 Tax=Nocardioides luteus TaxID=1844 RepID=A0A1J4NB27_9ACTN|nr:AIM24 family protein [Nocardioides luteus]OIJ28706.1 Tellurium resistance protein [Nocardioides luteus]
MTDAAWYPDPTGQAELRYYDGSQWTEHVSTGGQQSTAPLAPPQATVEQEAPTQVGSVQAAQAAYGDSAQAQPAQAASAQYGQQAAQAQPTGDPFAGISGDLIDGRFAEIEGNGAVLQNKKLLRVRVGEPFQARQGSMVAYQGNVQFKYQGGGVGKFLKRAVTGEGLSLMGVEGQGDVFLADAAKEVHILQLNNSGISINGDHVLAFSGGLQWNIERVQGAGMLTGGLFNTTLRGTGWVAVTTEGDPVVLNAAEAPTFADTNAVVGWSLGLQTSLQKSFTAGALIGRGSGEAFQVAFHGQGFVIVQPSEGAVVPPHSHS